MEIGTRQHGDLYLQDGFWRLLWREDAIDPNAPEERPSRKAAWIGPSTGPEGMTLEQAQQVAWENFLSRTDQNVSRSAVSVADFVANVFMPEHVAAKGLSGRTHYQAILKHVLAPEEVDRVFKVGAGKSRAKLKAVPNWPYLGNLRLCDVRPDDVQCLISAALERGYSTQTVTHIRNVVSAIFAHAQKSQWFTGDNPARMVSLPGMSRKDVHGLTLAEMKEVLGAMQYPEKEMALIAILTNMNVAEICGLQWKHLNLTESPSNKDGVAIPAGTIAVRQQWYLGELAGVRRTRIRDLAIPAPLLPILLGLSRRERWTGPDDFVLVSRAGTPINANNILALRLKPIGKDLRIPTLSWNVFRRTRSTLAGELGMAGLWDCVAKGS